MTLYKILFKSLKPLSPSSFLLPRTLTSAPSSSPNLGNDRTKKPLHLVFREAVGLCEASSNFESEPEGNELQKNLLQLEKEVRDLKTLEIGSGKENTGKGVKKLSPDIGMRAGKQSENDGSNKDTEEANKSPKTLYSAFAGKEVEIGMRKKKVEKKKVYMELSPDVEVFLSHLYTEGYFLKANFLKGKGKLDFSCFHDSYSRDFIKSAVQKFGRDHQEIAKWLSGSNLKKVALFGCPSLERNQVFSAKRLRKFFEIKEDTVCSKCVLKHSCKFVNQSVWGSDSKILNLADVMKITILYALEDVDPNLSLPIEITVSVNGLLRDVLKLSKTI